MANSLYLFTAFSDIEIFRDFMSSYECHEDEAGVHVPVSKVVISDGDDYLNQQKQGMHNLYQGLITDAHRTPQEKVLIHLTKCERAFKIDYEDLDEAVTLITSMAEHMGAIVFTPAEALMTPRLEVVHSFEGACEVSDYDFRVPADSFEHLVEEDQENLERKSRSLRKIAEMGVPTLDSLPVIPSSSQTQLRDTETLARRIITLAAVAVKGETRESEISFQVLEKYEIDPAEVSPFELQFLKDPSAPDNIFVNCTWRYESLYALMWAAGYMADLKSPTEIVEVPSLIPVIRDSQDFDDFVSKARPQNKNSVLDELDFTYRLAWACTEARVNNQDPAAGLQPGVVYERHYAFNWLINRYGEDWDNISTHT
ncbi:MAG: DUF4272 domain-containing protein [Bdellovibrionales bacterium]|nr:DUF4272 domain-containing protein [Bdellovibrionales bacterium]